MLKEREFARYRDAVRLLVLTVVLMACLLAGMLWMAHQNGIQPLVSPPLEIFVLGSALLIGWMGREVRAMKRRMSRAFEGVCA
jgi:hypothetical protein